MRRAGNPGRGERGRVERRVRALLGTQHTPEQDQPDVPARHRAPGPIARLTGSVGARTDPGRTGALAMAAVVAVVGVVAAFWVLSSRPRAIPVPPSGPATSVSVRAGPAASPSAMTSGSAAVLIVDVAGKVRRPGIYRLALGSRVDDAIRAAGGVLSGVDLATVNLAAVLVDGQQVAVGVPAAPGGAAGTSHAAGSTGGGPVRLNTATIDQLETLPGVGPVLAQHILDWRAAHGGFASVAQLDDVPGIGTTKFAELRPLVTV